MDRDNAVCTWNTIYPEEKSKHWRRPYNTEEPRPARRIKEASDRRLCLADVVHVQFQNPRGVERGRRRVPVWGGKVERHSWVMRRSNVQWSHGDDCTRACAGCCPAHTGGRLHGARLRQTSKKEESSRKASPALCPDSLPLEVYRSLRGAESCTLFSAAGAWVGGGCCSGEPLKQAQPGPARSA